jgi:hypothetical protein
MNKIKLTIVAMIVALAQLSTGSHTAEAGPLLDWLRGCRKKPCETCATPAVADCGLQPGQCRVTCQQTCARTVVNYVPYTAYRTSWEKIPVTQYKPVTSSDPCTGCTVTCMKPCTTYTWQQKQVPYTTYRPVYRQETYKVPVSYITNDCNSRGTCSTCNVPQSAAMPALGGCATCGIPQGGVMPSVGPTTYGAPTGTLDTSGSYYSAPAGTSTNPIPSYGTTPTPADIPPSMSDASPIRQNRPILQSLEGASWQTRPAAAARSARPSVARESWDYSPVRLASYSTSEPVPAGRSVGGVQGEFMSPAPRGNVSSPKSNTDAGWTTKSW